MSVGCDGVRVCSGELCSRYHVYKNLWDESVGEELPCDKDSGNDKDLLVRSSSEAKEHRRRPCTQEDISCLLAISGRSETEVL